MLNQTIKNVRQTLSQKPTHWQEFTGTIVHKGKQEVENIFEIVHKKEIESILSIIENAIVKAKKKKIGIFFFGD